MADIRERLGEWASAGLITEEQARAIAAHEASLARTEVPAGQALPPPVAPPPAAPPPGDPGRLRTTGAEAVGYVGAALALGAIILLLGQLWDTLLLGGRLAIIAVLTLALVGAGLALVRSTSPALQRLASVLLTSGVVGVTWLAGTVAYDVLDLRGEHVALVIGLVATAASLPLYLWRPRALPQLALAASLLTTVISALTLTDLPVEPLWFGIAILGLGAAWLLVALGGWLMPRVLAEIVGSGLMLLGAQVASFDSPRLVGLILGALIAGGLVGLAVARGGLHYLVLGALALFVLVPQLVFELFGQVAGAPAALLLTGLLLVLLAVGLGRARREVIEPRSTAADGGDAS